MIRRNVASQSFLIPSPLLDLSGTAQTTGAALSTRIGGVTAAGAGTLTHVSSGIWEYSPTQAETDTPALGIVLTKSGCPAVGLTVLTLADSEVASPVWDAIRASHATAGTFGEGVASVQGDITGSVDSVNQTVFVAGGTVDVALSVSAVAAGERDSIASALLDLANGVETGKTLRQTIRLMAAALVGKRSNAGTVTEQYDAIGAAGTARIVGNLDSSGNGTPTLTP